jgi:serine/threonine protein kinase
VHRDLKPSNVLLAEDGPRVIDFGISRAAGDSALTDIGQVVGTPRFMSPEQVCGKTAGPPSDVFSLGSVLAFAATGHPPFGEDAPENVALRIRDERPWLDGVPAEVRRLARRCLDKKPGRRPTPGGLVAELGDRHLPDGWLPAWFLTEAPRPAPASQDASVDTVRIRRHRALTLHDPGRAGVADTAFGPDGEVLAADSDGSTYLWDVVTGGLVRTFTDPDSPGVTGAVFSPGGSLLAAADDNGSAYLWRTGSAGF